jgi:hypothetical protein
MRALSATPVRLHVLEAYIETLKAENEILKRQLAAVETRAVQAKAEMATERLTARVAKRWPWRRLAKPSGSWRRRLRRRLSGQVSEPRAAWLGEILPPLACRQLHENVRAARRRTAQSARLDDSFQHARNARSRCERRSRETRQWLSTSYRSRSPHGSQTTDRTGTRTGRAPCSPPRGGSSLEG